MEVPKSQAAEAAVEPDGRKELKVPSLEGDYGDFAGDGRDRQRAKDATHYG